MKKNTCLTCMFLKGCTELRVCGAHCDTYMREPFKLAKGEAKWTFKRKAEK